MKDVLLFDDDDIAPLMNTIPASCSNSDANSGGFQIPKFLGDEQAEFASTQAQSSETSTQPNPNG